MPGFSVVVVLSRVLGVESGFQGFTQSIIHLLVVLIPSGIARRIVSTAMRSNIQGRASGLEVSLGIVRQDIGDVEMVLLVVQQTGPFFRRIAPHAVWDHAGRAFFSFSYRGSVKDNTRLGSGKVRLAFRDLCRAVVGAITGLVKLPCPGLVLIHLCIGMLKAAGVRLG